MGYVKGGKLSGSRVEFPIVSSSWFISWMELVKEADEKNLLWKYSLTVSSKVVYFGQNNYKRFDFMVIRDNFGYEYSLHKSKQSSKNFKVWAATTADWRKEEHSSSLSQTS